MYKKTQGRIQDRTTNLECNSMELPLCWAASCRLGFIELADQFDAASSPPNLYWQADNVLRSRNSEQI